MAVATELVTKFVFQGDTNKLDNYSKGLKSGIAGIAGFAAASLGAAVAVAKMGNSQLRSANEIIQLSKNSDIAVSNLQELAFTAEATGSTTQALMSTIDGLSQSIGDAAINGSEQFSRLGVSIRDINTGELKNAEELLFDISRRFQEMGLSRQEQVSFASSIGIDSSLINLLNLSESKLRSLREESRKYSNLTESQVKDIERYNAQIGKLNSGFESMKNTLAVALIPALETAANGISDFISQNPKLIEDIGKGLEKAVGFVSKYASEIAIFVGAFLGIKVVLPIIANLGKFLRGPLGIILAISAAVKDTINAITGKESLLADFFNVNFGVDVQDVAKKTANTIDTYVDKYNNLVNGLANRMNNLLGRGDIPESRRFSLPAINAREGLRNITINQDIKQDIKSNDTENVSKRVVDKIEESLQRAQSEGLKVKGQ